MSIAFVLGNGTSRQEIQITALQGLGTIYGCNALYREFSPHYLVSVDPKMIFEIAQSEYQLSNEVWTNYNKRYEKLLGFRYFDKSKGWSSGPTALDLATTNKHTEIYILGFDYLGLENGVKINNVYANTPNYKKSTDNATYHFNWLRQTRQVILNNPKIKFFRVIRADNYCPPELNIHNNSTIFYDEFKEKFNLNQISAKN